MKNNKQNSFKNTYSLRKDNAMVESCGLSLSDEDFMMLLPVALSYLKIEINVYDIWKSVP
jgi:hypothetical protein